MVDETDTLLAPPRNPARLPEGAEQAIGSFAQGAFVEPFLDTVKALRGQMTEAEAEDYALSAAMGLVPMGRGIKPVIKGIRAYHGSPHDFDRFDLSKIGTGEGGQSFGRGLYFAENEDVAKAYRDTFNLVNRTERLSALLEGRDVPPLMPEARMYEVNINANPDQFLDLDKRLGQQTPQVAEAMRGLSSRKRQAASDFLAATPDAEKRLLEAGIPGIKYLDQGSRTAGEGSRNYVVFDDKLITIIRKYGWAAVAADLGLEASQALIPVEGDPFKQPRTTPVEHNPFQ